MRRIYRFLIVQLLAPFSISFLFYRRNHNVNIKSSYSCNDIDVNRHSSMRKAALFQYNDLSTVNNIVNSNSSLLTLRKYRSISSANDSSFLDFVGIVIPFCKANSSFFEIACATSTLNIDADRLGYIMNDEPFTVSSIAQRSFIPEELALAESPEAIWLWWENRRKADEDLKMAVMSKEACVEIHFSRILLLI